MYHKKDVSSYRRENLSPLTVAVTGVSLRALIVLVYLFVLVCVVYLFLHTPM